MDHILKPVRYLILLALVAGAVSCFKEKYPVVGPPDDVAGDSITTPPGRHEIQRKVLIIGIDGCRGDALQKAAAPHIKGLLPHAVYSYDALTEAPTLEGPGWSSALTGVWGNKHGVKDNTFSGNRFQRYPMIFKYIKGINPRLKTVSVCSWDPLNDDLVANADVKISTHGNDAAAKDSAVARLKQGDPDVMLVELNDVNLAGNQYGFDTSKLEYMQAITHTDSYVGEILQAVNDRPGIADEDWLIILSSDHGGNASGYGGDSYAEKNIFVVFYNKAFPSQELVPPDNTLKVAHFLGVNQYASLKDTGNILDFDKYKGFTIRLDVKSGRQSGYDSYLTNKDWGSGYNRGWVISVDGQSWTFNVGDGSRRVDVSPNAPDITDNKWHDLAITVDKSGYVKLFQDDSLYNYASVLAIQEWNGNPAYGVKLNSGDDITGRLSQQWGNSVFSVANIRIWDTVISDEDMRDYMPCDTTISPDDKYYNNLVAWWPGTEGKGNTWTDHGPDHLDMNLTGSPSWVEQQADFCNNPLPPTVPTIVDIAPAVFKWLQISMDPGWGMDGRAWLP